MLGQPFQSGEITPPVRFLDPDPKRRAQRHHQERFCKVGILAERLFQNPRQPAALPSDFVRYGILPRMSRDLARRPSGERHNGRLAWDDTGRQFFQGTSFQHSLDAARRLVRLRRTSAVSPDLSGRSRLDDKIDLAHVYAEIWKDAAPAQLVMSLGSATATIRTPLASATSPMSGLPGQ